MGSEPPLTAEEQERLENRERRCRYGIDCGHTWAWSRGAGCPECSLRAALTAAETARDQLQAELDAHRIAYTAITGERNDLQREISAWDSTLGGVWADLEQVTQERDQLRAAIADLRHGFRQKEVWGSVWGALNAVSHDHAGIKPSKSGAKRIVGALLPVIDNVLQHYLAPETISAIALEARQVNEMRYRLSGAEYHRREAEERRAAAEARAARLAALETAAREWATATQAEALVYDSEGDNWPDRMGVAHGARQDAEERLHAAVANLATPPGEG